MGSKVTGGIQLPFVGKEFTNKPSSLSINLANYKLIIKIKTFVKF